MIKIAILTSRKNFVWKSMEEIIPFIEMSWQALPMNSVSAKILNIDETKMKSLLFDLMDVSHIIVSCFTPEIFQFLSFLRSELKSDHKFIVHLHNQSTIACWPMLRWGSPALFKKTDIFISSCIRDAECLKLSFPEVRVKTIPFSYKNLHAGAKIPRLPERLPVDLFFAGRLSSQKNLHVLIISLHLLKKEFSQLKWKMHFYGSQDNLGSPNMGWVDKDYASLLMSLVESYGLSEDVVFHGFLERKKLAEIINSTKKIFVAPSLHSDENFGMAAFQSLISGHLAVLSDWGGHADLKEHFQSQVNLTQVYRTQFGPYINPWDLATKIKSALENYVRVENLMSVPEYYSLEAITAQYLKLLRTSQDQSDQKDVPLSASTLAEEILNRSKKEEMKIFSGYDDPTCHPFLSAYGMNKSPKSILTEENEIKNFPWVKIDQQQVKVEDPHRGKFVFSSKNHVTKSWLLANGFAYAEYHE